jgi:lysozyme
MFDKAVLLKRLFDEESLQLKPYTDSVGKLTIGIGRNLTDNGITQSEATYLCINDIDKAIKDLQFYLPSFVSYPDMVQLVLTDMTFNMGIYELLKFKNTLMFIKSGDYKSAAEEMLNSKWAKQVGQRAIDLSEILKSA